MNREQVLTAAIRLHDAAQHGHTAFWVHTHSRGSFDYHVEQALAAMTKAAAELGYTLTPIVTPSPDSGRAKEIGDVRFEPHQAGGA